MACLIIRPDDPLLSDLLCQSAKGGNQYLSFVRKPRFYIPSISGQGKPEIIGISVLADAEYHGITPPSTPLGP